MTAVLLGALGLALSLVVPQLLARASWPARVPRAAIVLWQSLSAAAVLSAVGVVLAAPEEVVRASGAGQTVGEWMLVGALAVASLIVLRLVVSLVDVTSRSRARRARHRTLVDLLDRVEQHGRLDEEMTSGTLRVLEGPLPFAYCLPGRSARVVLSGGTLRLLAPEGVRAVLAHEQAHLRRRHDVVLESFTALYRAVPPFLRSGTSLNAVHLLLEMLADDAARHAHGDAPLREALRTMGGTASLGDPSNPVSARDAGAEASARLRRLTPDAAAHSRPVAAAVYLAALAVLVLPTVIVVVPWLTRALPGLPL